MNNDYREYMSQIYIGERPWETLAKEEPIEEPLDELKKEVNNANR